MTRYFPAVGIVVGAIAALCFWAAAAAFPPLLAAIFSTAVTIALTGAFHEDGLADTFDGLGGSVTRERALEIMKDSRIGSFGAVALILMLGAKVTALSILSTASAVTVLLAGHALSRWCAVLVMWRLPYARKDPSSRSTPTTDEVTRVNLIIATIAGLMPVALCGPRAVLGILIALATVFFLIKWYARRLGGYTGDTLGATQQATELTFYLTIAATWPPAPL